MIRGIIFKFFFYIGTIAICLIFLPALILPQKIDLLGGKILGHWIRFCLFCFLSVKIKVKGNGDIYYLHVRNASARLPWQYYTASFKTSEKWKDITISFDDLKNQPL